MSQPVIAAPPMAAANIPTTPNQTGTWRFERPVLVNRLAPCSEACPLGENIPAIMALNSQGAFDQAYNKIRKENPFPGICGRICFHPCERVCNRRQFDEPVSIQDMEFSLSKLVGKEISPEKEKLGLCAHHVGVLGSDIAGLSCAYFLALLGHRVTICEPGPYLRIFDLAAMDPRLSKEHLENEVKRVLGIGINIKTNISVKRDYYHRLAEKFEAVYISPGGRNPEILEAFGEPRQPSVYRAEEIERMVKEGKHPSVQGKVAIAGSGRRALRVARIVKEIGGQPTVLLPFSGTEASEMAQELEGAEKSGITLEFGHAPFALIQEGGKINGLMCLRVERPEPSDLQKGVPESAQGRSFEYRADAVIIASPERAHVDMVPPVVQETGLIVVDAKQFLKTSPKTDRDKGPERTIVRHIAKGKQAAMSLDLCLRKGPFEEIMRFAAGRLGVLSFEAYRMNYRPLGNVVRVQELNLSYFKKFPRIKPSSPEEGLTERQNILSARRCFQCGWCNSCLKCYEYCPDLAIKVDPETGHPQIDYDHCKGCGICVKECPRGAISLEKE